jgi:hypothetical protein
MRQASLHLALDLYTHLPGRPFRVDGIHLVIALYFTKVGVGVAHPLLSLSERKEMCAMLCHSKAHRVDIVRLLAFSCTAYHTELL